MKSIADIKLERVLIAKAKETGEEHSKDYVENHTKPFEDHIDCSCATDYYLGYFQALCDLAVKFKVSVERIHDAYFGEDNGKTETDTRQSSTET